MGWLEILSLIQMTRFGANKNDIRQQSCFIPSKMLHYNINQTLSRNPVQSRTSLVFSQLLFSNSGSENELVSVTVC